MEKSSVLSSYSNLSLVILIKNVTVFLLHTSNYVVCVCFLILQYAMIAFEIFGWPVYWYGIFYGITFLSGYFFLFYISKLKFLDGFPRLQTLLTTYLDTLVLWVIFGIMVGGRLGHVFLYDRGYYQQHLGEIVQTRQGGMSFIGGVIGVVVVLLSVGKYYKLSLREFLLLGDLILCIVPLGIFLGRIGNFLNKELYGIIISEGSSWYQFLYNRGLVVDYGVDTTPTLRINTNILQSIGEGLFPLIIGQGIFWVRYSCEKIRPGMIAGLFLVVYAIVRFFIEFLKEIPSQEMWGILTISQWIMFGFFIGGITLLFRKDSTEMDSE